MKILQLCLKPPLPAKDGGCIAMNSVTHGLLHMQHEVHVLSVVTHKHPFIKEAFGDDYLKKTKFESVFIDTRLNLIDAFSSLITQDNYNISRFFSPDFDKTLIHKLQQEDYDIIHLESLFMSPYIDTIRRVSKAKIVLRSHNLEYLIWERLANSANNKAKKTYLKYLAKQLKEYELKVLNKVDGIAAISKEDEKKYSKFGCKTPLKTIPFGINTEEYQSDNYQNNEKEPYSIFHLGAMDWAPNQEGINWFLQIIWPKIKKDFPDLPFYIAGRGMQHWSGTVADNQVKIIGEIDDAKAFIANKGIMIVPILSAGGIRVKIIEGMALKKTIVTTSIGAEGIDVKNNQNILLAEGHDDFYRLIKKALKQEKWASEIGANAEQYAHSHFNNAHICEELVTFYQSIS
jgi:glycosyltransferase involved in cell wall biosynthesis